MHICRIIIIKLNFSAYERCPQNQQTLKKARIFNFVKYQWHTIKAILLLWYLEVYTPNFAYSQPSRSVLAGNHFHKHTSLCHNSGSTNSENTMIFTLTSISNNIKTTLLLCYLLYQGVYALQLLHTASLDVKKSFHGRTNTIHSNSEPKSVK